MDITRASLKISRDVAPDATTLEQIRRIYEDNFPPAESIPFPELATDILQNTRWLFIAETGTQPVGFLICLPLPDTSVLLLDYLAISRSWQNQGIGSELLRIVLEHLRRAGNISGLVLEVEPEDEGTAQEQRQRRRRIQFYHKLGAVCIAESLAYVMPNLEGRGGIRMKLMWIPLSSSNVEPEGALLRDCIRGIYHQAYKRTDHDPLLQGILQNIDHH